MTKELQMKYPNDKVELWSFDEHRVGLKPIIKRVWSKKGIKEIAKVNHRYEWIYVFAYVQPETGETVWQILSCVNTQAINASLKDFSRNVNAGLGKQILLVMDRAGWHMSEDLEIPKGIHIKYLPPYSPELQPAERLWSLTDEPLVNKCFKNIETLIDTISSRCEKLTHMIDTVKHKTLFYWWPKLL